ncbi:MAG: hypothetical protein RSE13_13005 [Planktothrix sp. GU0601_MAG3]|nr:MAG: hypothetical protein RSE13_13005 [Planktothrix sp. GU0601_MAG3]
MTIIRAMDAITDTEVQKNFTAVMNQVCDDHAPIIMTRESETPCGDYFLGRL